MIQTLVDFLFSHPHISDFLRSILEKNFVQTRRVIRKELDTKKKTLDVGCGTGIFSGMFKNYTGIDISSKYLCYARRKYGGYFALMDASHLTFKGQSFHNVLVVGVLHHLDDATFSAVLSGIKRVLKKDGMVLVLEDIPTRKKHNYLGRLVHLFDSGGHIRNPDAYEKLLKGHFHVKKYYPVRSGVCDYGVYVLTKE